MQEKMTQNLEKKNVISPVIIKNLVIDGTNKAFKTKEKLNEEGHHFQEGIKTSLLMLKITLTIYLLRVWRFTHKVNIITQILKKTKRSNS